VREKEFLAASTRRLTFSVGVSSRASIVSGRHIFTGWTGHGLDQRQQRSKGARDLNADRRPENPRTMAVGELDSMRSPEMKRLDIDQFIEDGYILIRKNERHNYFSADISNRFISDILSLRRKTRLFFERPSEEKLLFESVHDHDPDTKCYPAGWSQKSTYNDKIEGVEFPRSTMSPEISTLPLRREYATPTTLARRSRRWRSHCRVRRHSLLPDL